MKRLFSLTLAATLLLTLCWEARSWADTYKVSRVKLQGKGKKLKVRYTLRALKAPLPAGAQKNMEVEVSVRCAYCGNWYQGESSRSVPSLARGTSATLTAKSFSWKDRLPAPRIGTCEVRWEITKSGTVTTGPEVITRCRRRGRLRAGACPKTIAYNKTRCRKVRASFRRARLSGRVARMGVLRLLGTRGRGSSGGMIGSSGGSMADAFTGVGGLTVAGRGGRGSVSTAPKGPFKTTATLSDFKLVSGQLDLEGASRAVRRALGGFRSTYERMLRRDPSFSVGKLTVEITVLPTGRAGSCQVSPAGTSATLEAGIKRYVERLRFPPPRAGAAKISFRLMLNKLTTKKKEAAP